jgi:F-type H+-transporting ATPase subunit epsilon|uniref:ATP synthase CF1 epsilon subunit n=1 Tax=Fibrocapsa japonica TaxID=94617 RepID=UPI002114DB2E|nr:ATP synthase CF1 epsilon subunit [Fibrocapsa japonica]UTE95170.1 ATP synthase CF1 epsilon subunit [Fibrocapsa japonica]
MVLNIKIIAPDRLVWSESSNKIILPTTTGQVGVLMDHAPMITGLDIGTIIIETEEKNWFPIIALGGFTVVEDNQVTILVNGVEPTPEISLEETEKKLQESLNKLTKVTTLKEKIESSQNVKKAAARLQALRIIKKKQLV